MLELGYLRIKSKSRISMKSIPTHETAVKMSAAIFNLRMLFHRWARVGAKSSFVTVQAFKTLVEVA